MLLEFLKCVSVHVGAQGLSPGDNLNNLFRYLVLFSYVVFEPLDRQKGRW